MGGFAFFASPPFKFIAKILGVRVKNLDKMAKILQKTVGKRQKLH